MSRPIGIAVDVRLLANLGSMSLTSTASITARRQSDAVPVIAGACPNGLVRAIRTEVRRGLGWQDTADCVVAALHAPACPIRPRSSPRRCASVTPPVTRATCCTPNPMAASRLGHGLDAGQQTMIHDHVAWCVTGVLQGREYEEIFALADGGRALRLTARNVNQAGAVSSFAPPGDIHRVRNAGEGRGHIHARLRRRHLPPRQQHPPRIHPPRPHVTAPLRSTSPHRAHHAPAGHQPGAAVEGLRLLVLLRSRGIPMTGDP
jgi:hypothetical protein